MLGWLRATRWGSERRVARLDHLGMPAGVVAYSADSLAPIPTAG
ncbi:hypothetical protein ACWC9T_19635 [Kitasatospora sp. NPDC001159]